MRNGPLDGGFVEGKLLTSGARYSVEFFFLTCILNCRQGGDPEIPFQVDWLQTTFN